MAQSSGSFSGSVNNGYQKLIVNWSSTQSIENNTSTIYCDMYLQSAGSIYIGERNNTTTIDGNVKSYSSSAIQVSGGFTRLLGSVSQTINHDSYGNKTFSMSSIFKIQATLSGTYYDNISASSGNIELPNIPRASTITVNDANIGSSTTININKKVSSFTTDLYWRVQGDSSWTSIGNTSQYSYGWTVPTNLYSRIPNAKTIKCEFRGVTKSGSTTIGEKTTTATFTATGNPTINSCTLVSTDSTTVNLVGNNRMIRYISTVKATISASGQNSATISSIKVNGKTATNGVVSFANADTNSYNVSVTDSRGYTTEKNNYYNIVWTNYIPLTINATVTRNQPTDGKVNIKVNGNYFNSSFRKSDDTYIANTLTLTYRIRVSGGSWTSWRSLTPTKSGNTYSVTYQESGYDYTKQYEMEVKAVDKVSTKTITGIIISKGKPIFNWGENFFNVNGTLKVNDIAILTNLYPVGSIYISVYNTNPSTYFGGTWEEFGTGRTLVGVDTSDNDFNTAGKTGGEKAHTLTINETPAHSHTGNTNTDGHHRHQIAYSDNTITQPSSNDKISVSGWDTHYGLNEWLTYSGGNFSAHSHTFTTDNTGGGNAHNNMQPYITVYMWKRTA